jgi:hypothetical protein
MYIVFLLITALFSCEKENNSTNNILENVENLTTLFKKEGYLN